jgi:hypothetical protein
VSFPADTIGRGFTFTIILDELDEQPLAVDVTLYVIV